MKSKDSNSKKSVSYQKKGERGHARPSFFWYDNDKDLKVCFFVTCVTCRWKMLKSDHSVISSEKMCLKSIKQSIHGALHVTGEMMEKCIHSGLFKATTRAPWRCLTQYHVLFICNH